MTDISHDLMNRIEELEFLQNLDRELQRDLNLEHVLAITLDWAMRRSAADTGLIARRQDEELYILRVAGYAYQYAARLMREPIPITSGILGRAASTGTPIYMAYLNTATNSENIYEKSRSHFAIPLIVEDETIGVLHLESRHPAHFSADMRRFLVFIANRAAIAIRNAELYSNVVRSEQLKSDMIRMISHDLRNPLNTVFNATAIMKRLQSQIPEPLYQVITSIESAAGQMRGLIEELLTLERLESGIQVLFDPVDLNAVLVEAAARVERDARAKQQEFILEIPDKPMIVAGEFAHLRQAMVNLIGNAIKYTPHKGRIQVRIERYGHRIMFDVTDNGYGISPERQKNLFKRFYRAHQPGTEDIEGTGLGLSLVKTIVERFKGEVWFKSEPGKGSVFGFWLPALEDEDVDVELKAANVTKSAIEQELFATPRQRKEIPMPPKTDSDNTSPSDPIEARS
ncbi:MAG: hypothetical protein CUN55_07725 [Phototrophicales bacterium]|nr:MAG: hypothetical protein CUN55_07725 [Phototrophicales bacterium]